VDVEDEFTRIEQDLADAINSGGITRATELAAEWSRLWLAMRTRQATGRHV